MLDARNRVLWSWSSNGPPINDLPVIVRGTIYVVGMDLLWVAIDSSTGKEKWGSTACGRATFARIRRYKRDMYLVLIDMRMYRENLNDPTIQDTLDVCRGNSILQQVKFPAGARLKVRGKRVFAVIRRRGRTTTREVAIHQGVGSPVGKVSALAGLD